MLNEITLNSVNAGSKYLVLKNFVEAGIKILDADFGFVWYKLRKTNKYELLYSRNLNYRPNYPRQKGANYRVQKQKIPLLVANVSKVNFLSSDTKANAKSVAVIPIHYQNYTYGNIVFGYRKKHRFTKEEQGLSMAFGNAMAQAITINRLHHSLEDIKHTLDHTPEPLLIFDPTSQRIFYINKSLSRQTGIKKSQLSSIQVNKIIHPSFQKIFEKRLNRIISQKIPTSIFEVVLLSKDKQKIPAEMSLQYVNLPSQVPHLLAIFRDLKNIKRDEKKIRHAAFHDSLTGLPNRFSFTKQLNTLAKNKNKKSKQFAIIFMDLDRFKLINDTLGHFTGDILLKQVANRLKTNIKRGDVVSRFGGDEFVILLTNVHSLKEVDQVIERIQSHFQDPFKLSEKQEVYVTFSMGISIFPKDGTRAETLLKNADYSLYRAKEEGGNGYNYYSNHMVSQPGLWK